MKSAPKPESSRKPPVPSGAGPRRASLASRQARHPGCHRQQLTLPGQRLPTCATTQRPGVV